MQPLRPTICYIVPNAEADANADDPLARVRVLESNLELLLLFGGSYFPESGDALGLDGSDASADLT